MKKYTVHMHDSNKATIECATLKVGPLRHDLVCCNDAGEQIAYFHTFLYWMEYQEPRSGCVQAVPR